MEYWVLSLSIIVGALCIYLLGTWKHNYFKKLGIPHPKPTPIFGNIAGAFFRTKAMGDIIQETYNVHPDAKYVGFYAFSSPVIMLRDPELVKSIMIKNFDAFPDHEFFSELVSDPLFGKTLIALKGDEWRDMRALLSPAFTSSKIKTMFKIVGKCAKEFADHLSGLNPVPKELDLKDTFGRFSLDVIASVAFGLEVNCMKDPDNEFYKMGKAVSDFSGWRMLRIFIIQRFQWLAKLLKMRVVDSKTANFFTNAIQSTIAARDAQGIVRPDMIQLLMQARDRKDKSTLSSEDMTAQALIFILGGLESPSVALSFTAQSLALNPDIQRKLQAEIDQVLERSSGDVSYEDLHAMKYLDAVISEALRMFPPSVAMDRIGTKGITLPPALPGLEPLHTKPRQTIWIPCYSFHHDPKYFPNPEKFDPERFNDENKSKISPLTYFPFGLGPRICIANRFALMEIKLALFYLLSKCNLVPTSKTQTSMKLDPKTGSMMLEGGFWIKVEPRK